MSKEYLILVDAHVHIYNCFDIKRFFNEAFRNFSHYTKKLKLADKFIGILLLTESSGFNYFNKLQENSNNIIQRLENRSFIKRKSDENCSVVFETANSNYIIIIAGQQIVSEENLEVLALGTTNRFEYGKNVCDTISDVIKLGALPVIPWGVGKWLGKREKIVQELIGTRNDFFLGDNSNRPSFWKKPVLFKMGEDRGIFDLPGSDPLSFKTEVNKPGSYGFYFSEDVNLEYPAKDLKEKITKANKQFKVYGRLENTVDFFLNQTKIQVNKKLKG